MKKKYIHIFNIVLVLILIVIVSVLLTKLVYDYKYNYLLESYDIPMYVKTVNDSHIGFNVATDALYFGIVPIGYGSSTREFNITNKYDHNILAKLEPQGGNLSDWVFFNNYELFIQPQESKEIKAIVHVPNQTKIGNYSANLRVYLYRR